LLVAFFGKRAGHSVTVLFRVYAKCLNGTADTANARIEAALRNGREARDSAPHMPHTCWSARVAR
jgi:hypothetical protein